MKSLAIILVLYFAWQSHASLVKICLIKNGFKDSGTDLDLVRSIANPEHTDRFKNVSKEKLAGVIVCLFQDRTPAVNLYTSLRNLIDVDDKVTKDEAKQMTETLDKCNIEAAGNDTKLLVCANVFDYPFVDLIAVIRDVPDSVDICYEKCKLTITEMYRIEQNRLNMKEILKYVPEEKMACSMGCKIDRSEKPLTSRLIASINKNQKIEEKQKKEMLETLNKCTTQEIKSDTYKLIKCLDLFKSPFIDLYVKQEK